MKLSQAVEGYVALRSSFGMELVQPRRILRAFQKAVGDIDLCDVSSDAVSTFIRGEGPITAYWHQKYSALNNFYSFAMGRGFIDCSPLPQTIPKAPQPLRPYIYTQEQLRQLLTATERLRETSTRQVSGRVMRMLILLLYGAGLRISEALSLERKDIDLAMRVLTIRDTKFHKSRLVPIGSRLAAELEAYADMERGEHRGPTTNSLFFVRRNGEAIRVLSVDYNFRRLCLIAGVRRSEGGRYHPRLHDLRHTAAVHRLIAWYRAGNNVERKIELLATYFGHLNLKGIQRYLTMTADLLQEASLRFERYAFLTGEPS